ncbi:hypothetical protein GCM10007863_08590 [Dyella mobilis]|nr:hypothetical protein GCM10007863_08590 [Dyella mobilis]
MSIYKHEAVAAYGSQQALADALGISRTAVTMWPGEEPIPEVHELKLRYELKPQIFGPRDHGSPGQEAA